MFRNDQMTGEDVRPRVDGVRCTVFEAMIYAAAFVADLRAQGTTTYAPEQAKDRDIYDGEIRDLARAKEAAKNAVRWYREDPT